MPREGAHPRTEVFLIALGATSLATAFDLRCRRIPNAIPGGLLCCALALVAAGLHPLGWRQAAFGLVTAMLITLPLFRWGWMGGGDAKLAIALGPALGFLPFLIFFTGTSIFGGVLALAARRRGEAELAYAPAMLLGLLSLLPLQWLSS